MIVKKEFEVNTLQMESETRIRKPKDRSLIVGLGFLIILFIIFVILLSVVLHNLNKKQVCLHNNGIRVKPEKCKNVGIN